jgi:hypothetical protein
MNLGPLGEEAGTAYIKGLNTILSSEGLDVEEQEKAL